MDRQNVLICGAGIAGISAAYHLAVKNSLQDILLVDERPPLSLTSDKSTECYRNWWPGPGDAMVSFMNRSIDLLEGLARTTDNSFHLNRRGYLFFTADRNQVPILIKKAEESSSLGAGPLRIHRGDSKDPLYQLSKPYKYIDHPTGADLLLDRALIKKHYPYISDEVEAGLHIRRAGWFSAQQYGTLLLDEARSQGVNLIQDRVAGVELKQGRIRAVKLESGDQIETRHFINAAGPYLGEVAEKFGIQLPIFNELHLKVSTTDHLQIIPRDAPMLIWRDRQKLPWTPDEQDLLTEDESSHWLLNEFPGGVHTRPDGPSDSPIVLMLWEYSTSKVVPLWPPPLDPEYPEIVLRGLATMIPGLTQYFDKPPRPFLDGGYYTKTRENRPLIGPLPVEGAWVIGALSGFGLMASMAAGELLATHILDKNLPNYAQAFELKRYQDPAYMKLIDQLDDDGQL